MLRDAAEIFAAEQRFCRKLGHRCKLTLFQFGSFRARQDGEQYCCQRNYAEYHCDAYFIVKLNVLLVSLCGFYSLFERRTFIF